MKRIITIILTVLSIDAQAQITLEHSYPKVQYLGVANIENEGAKFYFIDSTTHNVELYNANHSHWKTMPTDVPSSVTYVNVQYISKNLFDNDGQIEFSISYNDNSVYTTKIYNEDGSKLMTIPDGSSHYIAKVNNDWKLIVLMFNLNGWKRDANVYSLPGQYTGVMKQQQGGADAELFPNPMSNAATLRYTLPNGVYQAQLHIFNSAGIQVRSYSVTNRFNDVIIDRNDLPAGVYTYQLIAPGISPTAEKFIIQ